MGKLGLLPNNEPLVTLVISQDRSVVEQECGKPAAPGPVLGCQMSRPLVLSGGVFVRLVKIARFTDALPSEMAFEIEVHELCHVVATLQPIEDPCHIGNGGVLTSAQPRKVTIR